MCILILHSKMAMFVLYLLLCYLIPSVKGYSYSLLSEVQTHLLTVLVALTLTISLIVVSILCVAGKKTRRNGDIPGNQINRRRISSSSTLPRTRTLSRSQPNAEEIQLQNMVHQQTPDEFTFPRQNLTFLRVLGDGQYGVVHLAKVVGLSQRKEWITDMFAVKTVKAATPSDKVGFLRELDIMKKLKPHPNVLRLIGCCIEREPFLIIVEYVSNGNLLQLLERNRAPYMSPSPVTPMRRPSFAPVDQRSLLMMAKDVANGMAFLAYHKCIHRDLAARNVLVGSDFKCKVADFGRARLGKGVVDSGIKTKGQLPIRWMAVESLVDNVHTSMSDVWAFGVLLWEITTLGARPFPGMGPKQVLEYIRNGFRLKQPLHCAPEIYNIMMACWSTDPAKRPTFKNISDSIKTILDLNTDYVHLNRLDRSMYEDRSVFDPFERFDI